jgi:hypothetical protein
MMDWVFKGVAKTPAVIYKFGLGAKIIFPQFDTIIFTFMCYLPGDKID